MSNVVATLPKSSDVSLWTEEEKALVEAAGLVHTDARSGTKTLAERATVAAFLQHCARTGLDPIARQIYSIARKSKGQLKWQIQISIDGARLVAERTGQYEGQTTPEFTADGITWTQVWLSSEPPKAARVGVYRRGFREALYAVALWDAYVQTKDEWENGSRTGKVIVSDMWQKMGPLMLAKCAEMLALRKAFPQDLSGLYSSEEMAQATPPAAQEQPVSSDARGAAAVNPPSADAPAPEARAPQKDWLKLANAAKSKDELRPIFQEAQAAGDLNVALGDGRELGAYLWELRDSLPDHTPSEDVVDAVVVDDDTPVTEWTTAKIPNGDDA
ncbi:phage recombination protein Bet [Microbacterium sp. 77mftsu3.1]|uniref:phage recombination protein Bet n=1 Tax=Microbacterium sp. 77mftsu3.1 TaxID=1761802 RepID=UPI0003684AF7|nr:phage recombination protein Bet [Microbacterium sp. 77mftsu3.1]SDG23037.1 phage recombination protein Bet [Microbacterium sp. 77mftsu3.1]